MEQTIASLVMTAAFTCPCFAGRATLVVLRPPAGYTSVTVSDVTPDGRFLVGVASGGEGFDRVTTPFWWDQDGGYHLALPLTGQTAKPVFHVDRVSADGSTIVGGGRSVLGTDAAMRWRSDNPVPEVLRLSTHGWATTYSCRGVSDDGSLVAYSTPANFLAAYDARSVVWPSTSPLNFAPAITVVDGSGFGNAFRVVATRSNGFDSSPVQARACVHTPATGVTTVLPPPGGTSGEDWRTSAIGASPNGRYVVGTFVQLENYANVRWDTLTGSVFTLPCPAWSNGCNMLGVSDTSGFGGPITIGWTQNQTATFWRPDGRAEALWGFLANAGERLAPDFRPLTVTGITANGRLLVGNARLPFSEGGGEVGYFATLGSPCPADIDDGAGLGMPDDAVNLDDLLLALRWFEAGDVRFDMDNGLGSGVRDDAVTIDDLLYFLVGFEAGC